jgi:hypothetical protein
MNGVFVSGEVIRSREDGIARFTCAGIDSIASVGAGLRITES